MSNSDLISLCTLIVLCIATGAAVWELGGWKKAMKGKVAYDLARRLLHELYDIRDALDYVRTYRLMRQDLGAYKEQHPGTDIRETDEDFEAKLREAGNRMTWPKVEQSVNAYKVDCLEAEILWRGDVKQRLGQILPKIDVLWFANQEYIESYRRPGIPPNDPSLRERRQELSQMIYRQSPVREDKYRTEVDEIVAQTEAYLRQYLNG